MNQSFDKPFVLLTQNDCPNCERLKMMLARPLKGQFDDQIMTIHRQNDTDEFTALTAAHHIQTTPALLHVPSGKVLLQTSGLGEVQRFLRS